MCPLKLRITIFLMIFILLFLLINIDNILINTLTLVL